MRAFFLNAWDILLRFFGAVAALLGGGEIWVLCALMAADYGTGVTLALLGKSKKTKDGGLSARAGFLGILRKGVMLGIILLAAMLDRVTGQEDMLRRAATGFYICNEGISLIENAALLGVPVPGLLRRALQALRAPEDANEKLEISGNL